jgi:hypothetical protein
MAAVLCTPILIGMILLASCQNGIDPQTGDDRPMEGKGIAAITLADLSRTAARTILPTETPTFSKYVLSFTPGEGNTGTADDVTITGYGATALAGGNAVQVELEPGAWTVTVIGYQAFTIGEYLAAQGNAPLIVTAGQTSSAVVTIAPLAMDTAGAKGVFSYSITLPWDVTEARLILTPASSGDPLPVDMLADETTGKLEVAAGEYGLVITMKKGGLSAGVSESVHIYPGLESKAVINFLDGEDEITFADVVFLAGTVSAAIPTGVGGLTVTAYSDSEYSSLIATVAVMASSDAWLIAVPVSYIGQTVYVKAEADGFNLGYAVSTEAENTASVTELPAKGRTGITLIVPVKVLVTGVSLNKSATTLYEVGTAETLTVTIVPTNATNPAVTWSTSDASVATVNNGEVTAVGPGSATITAMSVDDDTKTASAMVTVVANLSAASVSGLIAPVVGVAPIAVEALSVPESANYTVESITWKKTVDDSPHYGNFDSETAYYAQIVLRAVQYYRFNGTITPTANTGTPAEGTLSGSEAQNTLTFEITFPATQSTDTSISDLKVNDVAVSGTGPNFNITVNGDVTSAVISFTKHAEATAEYKLGSGDYDSSATLNGLVLGANTVTVKIIAEAGNSTEYTITVTRNAETFTEGDVILTLWLDETDGSILASDSSVAITTAQNFTASVTTAYTTVQWYVDGVAVAGGTSITIQGEDYLLGKHRLDVRVNKGGVPYSTEIIFTVTE